MLAYPTLVEWGRNFKDMFSIGGLHFQFLNYSYSIFPMIVAAWMAKKLGDWLKDHLPDCLQMIFKPLITVFVISVITLTIIGPVIQGVANGIADFINWAVTMSGWIGGLLIGGFYQVLVIFGFHWGVVPLVSQQIASSGQSALNAIISDTMVAQGAAVLAVALKSRKENTRTLGIAAAVSAFCGVTEPAIYGINLRFRRVFISGLIGSAAGGLVTGLMHGTMYSFTGGLIGFSSFFNPKNPSQLTSFYAFLISSAVSIAVAFIITWLWGYNDDMQMGRKVERKQRPGSQPKPAPVESAGSQPASASGEALVAPVAGQVISLSDVKDDVFSSGAMGQGFAVIPEEDAITAPCDAEVTTVFETKHAIGLTTRSGAEVLIHVGIDTVMLNGQNFDVNVQPGAIVHQGDLLLTADFDAIRSAGYDPTVMVIVTDPHGITETFPSPA